jgi:hypothetical protein
MLRRIRRGSPGLQHTRIVSVMLGGRSRRGKLKLTALIPVGEWPSGTSEEPLLACDDVPKHIWRHGLALGVYQDSLRHMPIHLCSLGWV